MKIFRHSCFAIGVLTIVGQLLAQNQQSQPPATDTYGQALTSAATSAEGGDLTTAEQTLTNLNVSQPGSAAWYIETTQRLLQMVNVVVRDGSPDTVNAVGNLALQHLNQAGAIASDVVTQAQAKAIAGFIYEKLMGDPMSAIASYQAAVALDPNNMAAQEKLDRLQRADAILRARIQMAQH